MRRALLLPLLALAVLLVAATCGDNSTTTDSGIEGTVTIGPMCPVVQEDSPCPDQPYAAAIVINNADGDEVAETQSGDEGRFRVALKPGSYTLVPQSPSTLPYASEQQVTVVDGVYSHVDIQYDSGIR